jgi:tetratricopeptide (TPR) repeat protein
MWRRLRTRRRARDLRRSHLLRSAGRYDDSRRLLEAVLRRDPADPIAARRLRELRTAREVDRARALWDEGHPDEAEELLHDVLDRMPDEAEVHLWLAPMAVVREAFDKAAFHAHRAAQLCGDDPYMLFRAASSVRWHDLAAARAYLDRAKVLIPAWRQRYAWPFDHDVDHLEGILLFNEGEPESALAHLRRAFDAAPGEIGNGDDLAEILLRLDRPGDALDVTARALEHRPSDARLLDLQEQAREALG